MWPSGGDVMTTHFLNGEKCGWSVICRRFYYKLKIVTAEPHLITQETQAMNLIISKKF